MRFRRGSVVAPAGLLVLAAFLPITNNVFLIRDVGAAALAISLIALSISLLAGFGGMVSLAQTGVAGVAGYGVAIAATSHGWTPGMATLLGLVLGTLAAFFVGIVSARTYGVYFIMVTLAIGLIVYYYVHNDYEVTNGTSGIYGVSPFTVFGIDLTSPTKFYYICLGAVTATILGSRYLLRSQFGLSVQGVRDNPTRMSALGYSVYWHRVWFITIAGFVASLGGVLNVWYVGGIAPATVDLSRTVNVLVIAVIGGVTTLIGPVAGAVLVTYLSIYTSSYTDRYNTVIGVIFILVLYFAPNGLGGIVKQLTERWRRAAARTNDRGGNESIDTSDAFSSRPAQ